MPLVADDLLLRKTNDGRADTVAVWVRKAVAEVGTPARRSQPGRRSKSALARLQTIQSPVPVESWLSFRAHRCQQWPGAGSRQEPESKSSANMSWPSSRSWSAPSISYSTWNGVAKHSWLRHQRVPGMRVHLDSAREIDALLDRAVAQQWRVGVRLHAPDEHDAHDPRFGGQFGLDRGKAIRGLRQLHRAGACMESVHFTSDNHDTIGTPTHARSNGPLPSVTRPASPLRWLIAAASCPRPTTTHSKQGATDPAEALHLAARRFPLLREIWLENGRYMTSDSCVLAMTVLDVKERRECRYLICDGGRTNHALAADAGPHPLMMLPDRGGEKRLTTICGPTCMTDDRLGRWLLPHTITAGDVIVWMNAGAYHLPWETQFSHGLCAVVWFDGDDAMRVVRTRQKEPAWTVAS